MRKTQKTLLLIGFLALSMAKAALIDVKSAALNWPDNWRNGPTNEVRMPSLLISAGAVGAEKSKTTF